MENLFQEKTRRIFRGFFTGCVLPVVFGFLAVSCGQKQKEQSNGMNWAEKMAQSEMKRYSEAWMIEKSKSPKWGYTHGCVSKAMLDLFDYNGDSVYFKYAKGYADSLITEEGLIKTYDMQKFNIDNINPGKILFRLYKATGDRKYKTAIDTLVAQMKTHPRTSEGGFWHKKIYPHQMWLDGLYMASPFLAEYARDFNEPALFDDIAHQITLIAKHTYEPATGLFYHGWDESREQKWANKETGVSPNFWSRSIGWYAMALVDVLDFFPSGHPRRGEIIAITDTLAKGICRWQDAQSGVWYQVTNMGDKEGNYRESSGSCMFVYFLYKAMEKGYISPDYKENADKGFAGILKEFVKEEPDGTVTITNCCSVAGLGGEKNYRDGSFEYYIGEPVIDNDPKSVAPFIWAAMGNLKIEN
ncbi:MAG: glycoside hydrolase family 88 protein [Dysgonamonadaceae bacterium]|jgi:unsaturated rhamnogalacturonyl hydrolase|nr:glycoside hydrolase family 88 protein [Dysgonamonadaceae bacterium]